MASGLPAGCALALLLAVAPGPRASLAQSEPAPSASAPGGADDAAALFARGNDAYKAGDFAAAAAAYDTLRARGFSGPGLLYNLGNAHFKSGDLGRAIASYERALLLAPRDREVRENLDLARELCADRPSTGLAGPAGVVALAARRLTPDEWAVALEAAYVLLLATFVAPLHVPLRRSLVRRTRLAAAILLAAAAAALLVLHTGYRPGRRGVVIPPEITVRSGPGTGYLGEFTLHPGSVVRIEDSREEWVKIVYPPSLRGWTEAEGIEPL